MESSSSSHATSRQISLTVLSQSLRTIRSLVPSKLTLFLPSPMTQPTIPTDPGLVRLINTRIDELGGFATKPLNGATAKDVPKTNKQSHWLKSASIFDQNFSGNASPKNTISGLTTPGHLLHWGTPSFPSGLNISFFNLGIYCIGEL